MRNQDKKALGCLSLLCGGLVSIFAPVFLLKTGVESDWVWNILAPGWKLFPFGHADLPEMFLAFTFDAVVYAAVIYGIIYLVVWLLSRTKYS